MWAVFKVDKKKIEEFKLEINSKLKSDCVFYNPKILIHDYKKNKIIFKEQALLDDYIFCFNSRFSENGILNTTKFIKGLKYLLYGFKQTQGQIVEFIDKCKKAENDKGYLTPDFLELILNSKYKFMSGPFANLIFEIIKFQKNKIKILIGNKVTTIKKRDYNFFPI